jgi:demethylmenaquinone methyltransferase/2-methoxy-6-polyprenyl-1,4-benzoquinol methylase
MSVSDVETEQARRAAAWGQEKRGYVRSIFSDIAPRYDLLNHLLSLNIDRRWRRRAIAALGWRERPRATYLDLCAGTLDIAAELSRDPGFRGFVLGADFAEPMLRAGAEKVDQGRAAPVAADALQLPLPDDSVAGILVAFGVRNFADLDVGLMEACRVLDAGGRLVILEFSTPRSAVVRAIYHLYFHHVLPLVGGLLSGHRTAYRYLPASVANFPVEEELARRMERAGFADVRWTSLTFGIAAIHVGLKRKLWAVRS